MEMARIVFSVAADSVFHELIPAGLGAKGSSPTTGPGRIRQILRTDGCGIPPHEHNIVLYRNPS